MNASLVNISTNSFITHLLHMKNHAFCKQYNGNYGKLDHCPYCLVILTNKQYSVGKIYLKSLFSMLYASFCIFIFFTICKLNKKVIFLSFKFLIKKKSMSISNCDLFLFAQLLFFLIGTILTEFFKGNYLFREVDKASIHTLLGPEVSIGVPTWHFHIMELIPPQNVSVISLCINAPTLI